LKGGIGSVTFHCEGVNAIIKEACKQKHVWSEHRSGSDAHIGSNSKAKSL